MKPGLNERIKLASIFCSFRAAPGRLQPSRRIERAETTLARKADKFVALSPAE